jgi:RNase P subunit RPR2
VESKLAVAVKKPAILKSIPTRYCPQCNTPLYYKSQSYRNYAEKNNVLCVNCGGKLAWKNRQSKCETVTPETLSHPCPDCGIVKTYKTLRKLNIAIQQNRRCLKCAAIQRYKNAGYDKETAKQRRKEYLADYAKSDKRRAWCKEY